MAPAGIPTHPSIRTRQSESYGAVAAGVGIIEAMSELEKRRAKFMVEIKRERKEEYFRSTRERLLRTDPPLPVSEETSQPRLTLLIRISLAPNAILPLLRQESLLQELITAADTRMAEKCLRVMVVCSNALLDDLHLQEKEAMVTLLLQLLREHGLMGGSATGAVASALLSLAECLSCIEETMAADAEELICSITLELLQWAIPQPPSQSITDSVWRAMGAVAGLLSECEYDIQAEEHFGRNLLFYNGLLQLHPQLMRERTPHCLCAREVMLKTFQGLSLTLTLNHYPLVFEGQVFANFLMAEILDSMGAEWQRHALSTLTNLLVDYEPVDCTTLMGTLTRPLSRTEAFFLRLLRNDSLVGCRVKLLKILVSQGKFYTQWEALFDQFWREVADLCMEVLRGSGEGETVRMAVQILMVMHEVREEAAFRHHLLNQGAEPLLEHLLERNWEEGVMEEELQYLLEKIRWE